VIDPDGRACGCGNRGCLETYVSGPGIVATAMELMQSGTGSALQSVLRPLTAETVHQIAQTGDAVALETLRRTGQWLGLACANLINMLNLEYIVISGGVMAAGDMLLNPAIIEAQRRSLASSYADCRIVQSKLWPHAGVIGAAMLARDRQR
jgi:glucokinase